MYQQRASDKESTNQWENLKQAALEEKEKRLMSADHQIAEGSASCEAYSPSCWNPLHPPQHAVDSNPRNFWMSSGLYPSELVVTFGEHSTVRTVEITSVGIKRLEVMKCENGVNSGWEQMVLEDVDDADGGIQRLSPNIPFGEKASQIKIKIHEGFGAFVCIYKVGITGAASADSKVKLGNKYNSSHSTRNTDLGKGSLSSRLGGSPSPSRK